MPGEIFFIMYQSRATVEFSNSDLSDLLGVARTNNRKVGLTGVLLLKDGNFLQYIEGEKEPLDRTYSKIEEDTRHSDIKVLTKGVQESRIFKDWSMAFEQLRAVFRSTEIDSAAFIRSNKWLSTLSDAHGPTTQILSSFLGSK